VAGVYISYPFCQQKCSFCNFASDVASSSTKEKYQSELLAEIRSHKWEWLPETIYFGGGTPSLMPPALLREVLRLIPAKNLREVTLECAPGTLSSEAISEWRELGINRVSLGVQSFVADELRQTGRRHSAQSVESDVTLLRRHGISNINIDLIAGLPEQTRESWEQSLDWVGRLDVPHASIYIFETDEDSRLGKEILTGGNRYGSTRIPSDEIVADLYERGVARLAGLGLDRYEISNFAKPGFESLHNLKYWQLAPYIGFGLDAHSFDGHARWGNPEDLLAYFNRQAVAESRLPTDPAEEHFFVGLRLAAGIEPTEREWERFAKPIARWTQAGMLERAGPRLRLTPAAFLVSNEIFQEFVSAG
jgi:oxygen-independent coproporphyrinogen III oxidase